MNTSFKPSDFDKQAAASLEMMDVEGAAERVQAILHPQGGPTLTPAPQAQPASPTVRKKRSDAGVPKKASADPDEIVLHLTLAEARNAAIACGKFDCYGIAEHIQDQIIAQLQRRLDQLQKGAK